MIRTSRSDETMCRGRDELGKRKKRYDVPILFCCCLVVWVFFKSAVLAGGSLQNRMGNLFSHRLLYNKLNFKRRKRQLCNLQTDLRCLNCNGRRAVAYAA